MYVRCHQGTRETQGCKSQGKQIRRRGDISPGSEDCQPPAQESGILPTTHKVCPLPGKLRVSRQYGVMLRLPQLSDELWGTVYVLGRKHETEGSVGECRNHSRKTGQPQMRALSLGIWPGSWLSCLPTCLWKHLRNIGLQSWWSLL